MKKAFDAIKTGLIARGYGSASADAQAAAYTRMMPDSAKLTKKEILIAIEQIITNNW